MWQSVMAGLEQWPYGAMKERGMGVWLKDGLQEGGRGPGRMTRAGQDATTQTA